MMLTFARARDELAAGGKLYNYRTSETLRLKSSWSADDLEHALGRVCNEPGWNLRVPEAVQASNAILSQIKRSWAVDGYGESLPTTAVRTPDGRGIDVHILCTNDFETAVYGVSPCYAVLAHQVEPCVTGVYCSLSGDLADRYDELHDAIAGAAELASAIAAGWTQEACPVIDTFENKVGAWRFTANPLFKDRCAYKTPTARMSPDEAGMSLDYEER